MDAEIWTLTNYKHSINSSHFSLRKVFINTQYTIIYVHLVKERKEKNIKNVTRTPIILFNT